MADSVYRVTEVIGVSGESWEAAARAAVETAAKSVRAFASPKCSDRTSRSRTAG
jgi:flavin-binding protein dodecin